MACVAAERLTEKAAETTLSSRREATTQGVISRFFFSFLQRGNRYERAAKLGASCLREIFLEIRRYTFEQDNIAAILPHEQVAYGFPLYAGPISAPR